MQKLRIDIWSDIACPWCYVGKRRMEAALQRFTKPEAIEIVWRAFELNPSSQAEISDGSTYVERLAKKYHMSTGDAEAMISRMKQVGTADGLNFQFERIRQGSTFDAHRLVHLGLQRGLQDAVTERLFRGYFSEGEPIGQHGALERLAIEAGLDRAEVTATLSSDAYADAVRADEQEARELGIHGVPFFVLGGRYAVSGAQPAELLLGALKQAFDDVTIERFSGEGAVCGPDECT